MIEGGCDIPEGAEDRAARAMESALSICARAEGICLLCAARLFAQAAAQALGQVLDAGVRDGEVVEPAVVQVLMTEVLGAFGDGAGLDVKAHMHVDAPPGGTIH